MAAGTLTVDKVVLGNSVTDSQNFLLKTNNDGTLVLARGTTGSLGNILSVDATGNITVLTQPATDNSTRIASTSYTKSIAIGHSQTWQNMTASRVVGTTYTNSTDKPITVSGWFGPVTSDAVFSTSLVIGGITVMTTGGGRSGAGANGYSGVIGVVPVGATYTINGNLTQWNELR